MRIEDQQVGLLARNHELEERELLKERTGEVKVSARVDLREVHHQVPFVLGGEATFRHFFEVQLRRACLHVVRRVGKPHFNLTFFDEVNQVVLFALSN